MRAIPPDNLIHNLGELLRCIDGRLLLHNPDVRSYYRTLPLRDINICNANFKFEDAALAAPSFGSYMPTEPGSSIIEEIHTKV